MRHTDTPTQAGWYLICNDVDEPTNQDQWQFAYWAPAATPPTLMTFGPELVEVLGRPKDRCVTYWEPRPKVAGDAHHWNDSECEGASWRGPAVWYGPLGPREHSPQFVKPPEGTSAGYRLADGSMWIAGDAHYDGDLVPGIFIVEHPGNLLATAVTGFVARFRTAEDRDLVLNLHRQLVAPTTMPECLSRAMLCRHRDDLPPVDAVGLVCSPRRSAGDTAVVLSPEDYEALLQCRDALLQLRAGAAVECGNRPQTFTDGGPMHGCSSW